MTTAGEEANEEARKEDGGEGHDCSLYQSYSVVIYKHESKGKTFAHKCEAADKEDEDEPRGEKASQVFLLFRKNPAGSHPQVLSEAERGGDDRC